MHKVIRATLCPHLLFFFFSGVTGVMIAVWNPACTWITSMTKACVMTFGDICIFICWHFEFLCTLPQVSLSALVETLGCAVPRAKWTWLGRDAFDPNHPRSPSGRLSKGGSRSFEDRETGCRHAEREAASDSPWQRLRSGRRGCGLLMWRRVAYTPWRGRESERDRRKGRKITYTPHFPSQQSLVK